MITLRRLWAPEDGLAWIFLALLIIGMLDAVQTLYAVVWTGIADEVNPAAAPILGAHPYLAAYISVLVTVSFGFGLAIRNLAVQAVAWTLIGLKIAVVAHNTYQLVWW